MYFSCLKRTSSSIPVSLKLIAQRRAEEKFLSKLRSYWRHNREERFKISLGITHFRVLTITPNERRAENLRRLAKEADDKREGSPMYLFLSETQYSLTKPDGVLAPIWASPKGGKHGILE